MQIIVHDLKDFLSLRLKKNAVLLDVRSSAEHHKGDIGNFIADANGNATVKFSTNEWCIGCEDETKNIVGKGLIVHKGTDDFTSQPAGNAGARVACSAIIK